MPYTIPADTQARVDTTLRSRSPPRGMHGAHSECRRPVPATHISTRALQLYRDVWSQGNVQLLDTIMDPDHAQLDIIWQGARGGEGGRERMQRGIAAYRSAYPDIDFEILYLHSSEDAQSSTIEWSASYTPKAPSAEEVGTGEVAAAAGERTKFRGVSILRFSGAGQIEETRVYREPPADEMLMYMERKRSEVETQT